LRKRSSYRLISIGSLFVLLALCWSSAPAQEAVPKVEDSTLAARLSKRVTIDADDAFLPSILAILAEKSDFNIVTGPGVGEKERICVHLKNTPIEEAINLVVRAAGLSYEIVGNSFLVAETEQLEKEIGLTAYVIQLQYANADEVKALLQDLTENIQVETSGNRILIMASPKVIAEVREVIKQVDQPAQQIMLEARLVEVYTAGLEKLGIDWEQLSQIETGLAENATNPDGSGRPPGNIYRYEDEFGVIRELGPDEAGTVYERIDGFKNIGHFSRRLTSFEVALDFLIKRDKARVLANSKVTTMNNREAAILIGEVIPFTPPNFQVVAGGGFAQQIIERDSVGVKLRITPTINKAGFITVKVEPEVSSIIELVQGYLPRKKIRTATTTVMVRDGQKIFIGGLLSVDNSYIEHKVPVLGDIPLLGYLFRHKYQSSKKTDLLIEITPHIIDTERLTMTDGYIADTPIYSSREITDLEEISPYLNSDYDEKYDLEALRKVEQEYLRPAESLTEPRKE
jgi:type IV pilus assembly protein PilQ